MPTTIRPAALLVLGLSAAGVFAASPPVVAQTEVPTTGTTPRIYQQGAGRDDPFAHLAALEAARKDQPASNDARRAAMVARIRHNIVLSRSTIDHAEVDRVLAVIAAIPREKFVPPVQRDYAYVSFSLPIGHDQTISDAYIVAVMTAAVAIRPGDRVLDIGTGSGYQAAVAARLGRSVVSVEIVAPLAVEARRRLKRLGYRNVAVIAGDGYAGHPPGAPYDAIIVAAGARAIPQPLLDQLGPGGRLVMPIGDGLLTEQLVLVRKSSAGKISQCSLGPAGFVPFTGRAEALAADGGGGEAGMALCYGAPVT